MDHRSQVGSTNPRVSRQKYAYYLAGIAIAAVLGYMVFRSLGYVVGQGIAAFQFNPAAKTGTGFDMDNFSKVKTLLKLK